VSVNVGAPRRRELVDAAHQGELAVAVAATAFRRGERWAWWGLLIGNALTYVGAMTYDQIVQAVGPFELTEYLGLAVIIAALAVTAPSAIRGRDGPTKPSADAG
jgi:hypothetical protein